MNQLSAAPALDYTLTILDGSEKGKVFRIKNNVVRIGRDDDNDIVLKSDRKASRKHALIIFTERGPKIKSLADKNSVTVDKIKVSEAMLVDGSVILLGSTKFQFRIHAVQALAKVSGQELGNPIPYVGTGEVRKSSSKKRMKSGGSSGPKLILLIIGGLFIYLLLSDDKTKPDEVEIRTETERALELERLEKQMKEAQESVLDQDETTAKAHWVKGFRDYKNGNYALATKAFNSCLVINPADDLCQKYRSKANSEFDRLVQHHMVDGRKAMDQFQFRNCISSFRNVIVMIQDTTSDIYKEAKSNKLFCESKIRDTF